MSFSGVHVLCTTTSVTGYKKWYDRKFAFLPVMCNGEQVWFKHYYTKMNVFGMYLFQHRM